MIKNFRIELRIKLTILFIRFLLSQHLLQKQTCENIENKEKFDKRNEQNLNFK